MLSSQPYFVMNIACNECRQRLSDALDETANAAAQGALAEHLAGCDSCRAELELLQAARAELRAFPVLVAPADLRARVRAQLEAAPVVPERLAQPIAEPRTIIAPANIRSIPDTAPRKHRHEMDSGSRKTWRDHLRVFLNNSTAITWASCCVLLLVYFVSLSRRPQSPSQYEIAERAPLSESQKKQLDDNSGKTPVQQPLPRNAPAAKPLPRPAEPGKTPELVAPALPDNAPPVGAAKPADEKPSANSSSSSSERGPAVQEKPAAPASPTKPAPKSDSVSSSNGSLSTKTRSGQNTGAPARARSDESNSLPSPAPAPERAKKNFMARSTPDSARGGASAPAASASEDRAATRDETSQTIATREITTRVTPPRSVGWAQVSVVLSGGARFDDGQKARVIWSGAAQAKEPIELSFSVQGAGGTAKISLQEVKKGQAQTLVYKTVAVGASQ